MYNHDIWISGMNSDVQDLYKCVQRGVYFLGILKRKKMKKGKLVIRESGNSNSLIQLMHVSYIFFWVFRFELPNF